jgi:hypothetical protein
LGDYWWWRRVSEGGFLHLLLKSGRGSYTYFLRVGGILHLLLKSERGSYTYFLRVGGDLRPVSKVGIILLPHLRSRHHFPPPFKERKDMDGISSKYLH